MNATVAQLINEQINKEFYSAYLYLDFANYYAAAGLDGFENWYRVQAQEERDHALLFFQYLLNNGVAVSFGAVDAPDWTRGDHMTPLKKALEHEQYVTSLINGIYADAYDDRDFRTMRRHYTAHPDRNLLREPRQRINIILARYLRRITRFSALHFPSH